MVWILGLCLVPSFSHARKCSLERGRRGSKVGFACTADNSVLDSNSRTQELRNSEIITWVEVRCLTDWATEVPPLNTSRMLSKPSALMQALEIQGKQRRCRNLPTLSLCSPSYGGRQVIDTFVSEMKCFKLALWGEVRWRTRVLVVTMLDSDQASGTSGKN